MGHKENDKPLAPKPDILPVPQRQLTAEERSSLHDFVMSHFKPCSHTPGCPLRSDVSPERRLAGEIRERAQSIQQKKEVSDMDEFEKWIQNHINDLNIGSERANLKMILNEYRAFKAKAAPVEEKATEKCPFWHGKIDNKGICSAAVDRKVRECADYDLNCEKKVAKATAVCQCGGDDFYTINGKPHCKNCYRISQEKAMAESSLTEWKNVLKALSDSILMLSPDEVDELNEILDTIKSRYRPASPAVEGLVRDMREWIANDKLGGTAWTNRFYEILAKYDNAKGGK